MRSHLRILGLLFLSACSWAGVLAQELLLVNESGDRVRAAALDADTLAVARLPLRRGSGWKLTSGQHVRAIEADNFALGVVLVQVEGTLLASAGVTSHFLPQSELSFGSVLLTGVKAGWVPGFGSVLRLETPAAGIADAGPVLDSEGRVMGVLLIEADETATIIPIQAVVPAPGKSLEFDIWQAQIDNTPALSEASTAYRLSDWQRCLSLARTIPGDRAALLAALSNAQLGGLQIAARSLGQIVSAHPENAYAMATLAALYHQGGYHTQSLNLSRKALQIRPAVPYANSILAAQQLFDEKFEQSLLNFAAWRDIGTAPADAAFALFGEGTALLRLERPSEALKKLLESEQARVEEPTDRIAPRFLNRQSLSDPRDLALARALGELGRWKEALRRFEATFERNPSLMTADLLVEVGEAYSRLGRWVEACEQFRRATALQPESAKAHHWLGVALGWTSLWSEAAQELKRASELAPQDAETHYMLGVAFANLGELDKAAAQVAQLRTLSSDLADQLSSIVDQNRP